MDELRLLRDLHADLPPVPADRLARGREHLLASVRSAAGRPAHHGGVRVAASGDPGARTSRRTARDGRPGTAPRTRRRLVIGGVATAGLAAGLAAALVVAPTAKVGHHPPVTVAGAAAIFTHAADAAATRPDLRPRPDQFVYVESESRPAAEPGSTVRRRAWLSADGRHAGLMHNQGQKPMWLCDHDEQKPPKGGDGGLKRIPPVDLANPPTGCTPVPPAYDPSLPTAPGAALTWLYRHSHGGNPPDVQAFRTVGDTIRESYVSPAAMAAIFKAAARIPGVKVIGTVVDLAGRKGIAVGQTFDGIRDELLFDPTTYRPLGERTIVDHDASFRPAGGKSGPRPSPTKMKDGTVLYSTAVLKIAITDRAGRPPR
jgi:hypothetical protein